MALRENYGQNGIREPASNPGNGNAWRNGGAVVVARKMAHRTGEEHLARDHGSHWAWLHGLYPYDRKQVGALMAMRRAYLLLATLAGVAGVALLIRVGVYLVR